MSANHHPDVVECLVNGGIPAAYTAENLSWLAQTHRALARSRAFPRRDDDRAAWHIRWAAQIEAILESSNGD